MEKQYQNEAWLRNKYLLEKLPTRKIGKMCNVSHLTISRHLKNFNIPIRSISEAHLGRKAWNKGLTRETDIRVALSEETKRNISKAGKGRTAWNKGISPSEGTKHKISKSTRGKNGNNWKGGITSLILLVRSNYKNRQWRSDVYTRDNFTCQMCGDYKNGELFVHHIESLSSILQKHEITTLDEALNCEELWNINNGITLCEECHIEIHKKLRINNKLKKKGDVLECP